MSILHNFLLLLILLLIKRSFIFCIKTEIKFYLNNVPSLFRCKNDGPLIYFDRFPNDKTFEETLNKNTLSCDLSLSSIKQRAIVEINRLDLLCEIIHNKQHMNEFLVFSSQCSTDLCKNSIPSTATIITEYKTGIINIERIDLAFDNSYPNQFMIGKLTNGKYLSSRRILTRLFLLNLISLFYLFG